MNANEAEKALTDVIYQARWVDGIKDQTGTLVSDAGLAAAIRAAGFIHIDEKPRVLHVAFEVGDVVREVGEEEPTGEIIQIKEGVDENCYIVKLYKPTLHSQTIPYYIDEIELIRRRSK